MNCVKCGKELEENEKGLCKDCMKKEKKAKKEKKENPKTENEVKETKDVLEEIIEEEKKEVEEKKTRKPRKKKEEVVEEEKKEVEEKIEEKAVESEKEDSVENVVEEVKEEKKEKKNSKIVNIVVGIILAVLIIVVAFLCAKKVMSPKVGSSVGNIRNYGYSVADNGWVYFMSFGDDGQKVTLNKIRQNGKDQQEITSGETGNWTILSLNVEGGWLYFIGLEQIDGSSLSEKELATADLYDNKIYKVRTNGKDLTVINDNDFNEAAYEMYVVDGRIYYQGTDGLLYSMDTNGEDRRAVLDTPCTPVGITDKYIFYTKTNDQGVEVTACMDLNGENEKEINGSRLYSINVVGDDIYYVKEDLFVYKTSITNGGEELVSDKISAYNMVVEDDWIYYLDYIEEENEALAVGIFRMKTDGTEVTNIKKLASYSSFLNIVGNWIYYTDSDDQYGYVKLLKLDGSEEITLYSLDFFSSTEVSDEQITTEESSTEENQ